jgi:Ca2+-transporting ATPase
MASQGMRVIAVAVGDGDQERDLRLLGLVGLADPPGQRPSRRSVRRARQASGP